MKILTFTILMAFGLHSVAIAAPKKMNSVKRNLKLADLRPRLKIDSSAKNLPPTTAQVSRESERGDTPNYAETFRYNDGYFNAVNHNLAAESISKLNSSQVRDVRRGW